MSNKLNDVFYEARINKLDDILVDYVLAYVLDEQTHLSKPDTKTKEWFDAQVEHHLADTKQNIKDLILGLITEVEHQTGKCQRMVELYNKVDKL